MTQRLATLSDASSLAAISLEVWVGTYLRDGVNGFFADYALAEFTAPKMRALIEDPKELILVSQNKTGIDGFIRLSTDSQAPVVGGSDCEVTTLYVQPRHHGKGIGKRLLSQALARCEARAVWLKVNAENTPAIAFYQAQGFEEIGETAFRIDDQAYLNKVYGRQL